MLAQIAGASAVCLLLVLLAIPGVTGGGILLLVLKNGDVQAATLAELVLETGHAVDLSKLVVLDQHQHTTTRCMLERWHIQTTLNRERGTLAEVYAALLD